MSTNDTVVFTGPNEVALKERPRPVPGANEVLVETERSLISTGTELTLLAGEGPEGSVWDQITNFPIDTPGYCAVGRIAETGDGVDDDVVGDRVATWNHHARYAVAEYDEVVWVPADVSADHAAFTSIAQIVMNGVRIGRVEWGEAVGVYGMGLLGQFAVRFCRAAGARPVIGLDLAEERLNYAPDEPEVLPLDPASDGWFERIEDATRDRLADAVFEVTGNPDAITGQFEILKDQGRLVVLSSPRGETRFDFHDYCNRGSYEIIGAHVYAHPPVPIPANPWTKARNAELFYDLLADDRIDVESLISHREPIENAPETYDSLVEDRTSAMGVLFEW